MTTILDRIKTYKLEEVAERKTTTPLQEMQTRANAAPPPRGFTKALKTAAQKGYGLIAEIKKGSPSKGLIRTEFDPATLARAYQDGGATCLSVLTDGPSFMGSDEFLTQAHGATTLPCLRKDFIYDPWQVVESRALHADCILLILAALSDEQAAEIEAAAIELGMDVLVEVHNTAEMERACNLKSRMLGINNRNLHTFEVSLDVTRDLARRAPEDCLIVAESGLSSPADLADMALYGARCFLIGEALMREKDVEAATRAILSQPLAGRGGSV